MNILPIETSTQWISPLAVAIAVALLLAVHSIRVRRSRRREAERRRRQEAESRRHFSSTYQDPDDNFSHARLLEKMRRQHEADQHRFGGL